MPSVETAVCIAVFGVSAKDRSGITSIAKVIAKTDMNLNFIAYPLFILLTFNTFLYKMYMFESFVKFFEVTVL